MQVILTFRNRSVIYPAAMDTQEVKLTTQSNFDIFFYHKPELLKRLYRSFFLSQSISTFCCPICAYSFSRSSSCSFLSFNSLSLEEKTLDALFKNSFFHVWIWFGWTSYLRAIYSTMLRSFRPSNTTFALKSALNFRLFFFSIITTI